MPFFSVIIPVYNKEKFIENTIKSVLQQSFVDFELLLINDGSTDESVNKIENFTDDRISFYTKENGGASSARNFGLEKAKATYITFLDADDYWYPDFLQEMATSIEAFPNHKIFSAAIEVETEKVVFPSQYSVKKSNEREIVDYFVASMKTTIICTSCAAFHKSVFEKVGRFDTEIKSGQDTDMWIRLGVHFPVVFSWKILARYVYDPNSLSRRKEYSNKNFNFDKFKAVEKTHPNLKRFIDFNNYSLAIRSKLINDKKNFGLYYNKIDVNKLPLRKRLLLELPSIALRTLIKVQAVLVNLRLHNSRF
jgi:glycosyltransferase involved in cell wall biosynthesis